MPRRLFRYLPNSIMDHQNVFCEITFQNIIIDEIGTPLLFEPDVEMKVKNKLILIQLNYNF